jgi:hypothetical protein
MKGKFLYFTPHKWILHVILVARSPFGTLKQDMPSANNVTMRRVHANIVAVGKQ